MLYKYLLELRDQFPNWVESDHFRVGFGPHNPRSGPNLGISGHRDLRLIPMYLRGLEQLHSALMGPAFERSLPRVGPEKKTIVYIANSRLSSDPEFDPYHLRGIATPFMDLDDEEIPYIVLAPRTVDPSPQGDFFLAQCGAIHEATHVFNWSRPQMGTSFSRALWRWLDEGTAVFMETWLQPGNIDWLRYALDWCDHPEAPLDHNYLVFGYSSSLFVRYLVRRLGAEFLGQLWEQAADLTPPLRRLSLPPAMAKKAERWESPLQTAERLLRERLDAARKLAKGKKSVPLDGLWGRFHEVNKAWPNRSLLEEVIWPDYCLDSYFLWDHNSAGFAPEVFARYGERSVTESFGLASGHEIEVTGKLDHLACRYYRFYPDGEFHRLTVTLETPNPPGLSEKVLLHGQIAVVTDERARGRVEDLQLATASSKSKPNGQRSIAVLDAPSGQKIDHVVLVVSNVGDRVADPGLTDGPDDDQTFTVTVRAD